MLNQGYPKLVFNNNTNNFTVTTTGSGNIRTWEGEYEEDTRPEHVKFFGMDEETIYKKYGICFKETDIFINGVRQYEMSSDFEAMLWLIRKGFVKYVREKKYGMKKHLTKVGKMPGLLLKVIKRQKNLKNGVMFILLKVKAIGKLVELQLQE